MDEFFLFNSCSTFVQESGECSRKSRTEQGKAKSKKRLETAIFGTLRKVKKRKNPHYESRGQGFESLRARQKKDCFCACHKDGLFSFGASRHPPIALRLARLVFLGRDVGGKTVHWTLFLASTSGARATSRLILIFHRRIIELRNALIPFADFLSIYYPKNSGVLV
ncbi:hypothetical protein [Anaeromassilibacillus senegalensis]|uniref:hypothetical protein n=1 Tax=Anaeromassilibacillus senegalensis TaxID=1673717 RepID=UPI0006808C79|nr:hypothetical protein [Anaeromassilibacillus senegalensis]